MRILLLSQWFDPEPCFKGLPFAKALSDLGHEVIVLTGFPNYPEGTLYPGYKLRAVQREKFSGIDVIRVPLYPSHDNSGVRRVANYASFALSSAVLGAFTLPKVDVAYAYHPPGTIGLPAMALAKLRRIPFVYDIQDLWPDSVAASGMLGNKRILTMLDRWSRLVYRQARHIVVLSPGYKATLVDRGVPAEKVSVIYNWCDEEQIHPEVYNADAAQELGFAGKFNIVFAGTMGAVQALDSVLDAAGLLLNRVPQVQFVFIGGGIDVARLQKLAEQNGLSNVKFLPRRPASEIGTILSLANVLLVHLKDDPLFSITIPSKTQAYLRMGRPILMAVNGDAADLVHNAGAGLCCPPQNPQALADTVVKLAALSEDERAAMGRNGARYYAENLAIHVGAKRFADVFAAAKRQRKSKTQPNFV